MAEPISIQQLKDASEDVKSLEEVVNGDENVVVTTRLGETYPSVKGSIKKVFEIGGIPATPFATKALMTASALVDGKYALVTDDTVNNGLYVKTAGAWVKSNYDPSVKSLKETQAIVWLSKYNEHTNLVNTGKRLGYIHSLYSGVVAMEGAVSSYPIQVNEGDLIIAKAFAAPSSNSVVCLNELGEYIATLITGDFDGIYKVIPSGVKYIVLNLDASKIDECYVYNLSNERLQWHLNVSQTAQQIVRSPVDIAKEIPEEIDGYLDKDVFVSRDTWNTSGYIPVKPLSIYSSTANSLIGGLGSNIKGVHYYDVDKNIISFGKALIPYETFTTPKDCAFVRINYAKAASPKNKLEVYEGSTLVSDKIEEMITSYLVEYKAFYVSRHKGKTLVTLGTSIVDSIATPTTYPKYVREKMGLVHYEHAFSGSRTRESLVKRSADLDTHLLAADFVTLDHGTNDFKLETSLGTIEDTPTDSLLLKDASSYANRGSSGGTFIADIKGIIEYIYNVNPSAKILLITPIRRSQPAANGTDTNNKGHTLADYANAILSVAKLYAIPVLDNYNESGFNDRTIPTWTKDGLHPTDWAQQHILANKVIGFLESN